MNGGGNFRVVKECKSLRECGMCPRECACWRPNSSFAKDFCKRAMRAENRKLKRKARA